MGKKKKVEKVHSDSHEIVRKFMFRSPWGDDRNKEQPPRINKTIRPGTSVGSPERTSAHEMSSMDDGQS